MTNYKILLILICVQVGCSTPQEQANKDIGHQNDSLIEMNVSSQEEVKRIMDSIISTGASFSVITKVNIPIDLSNTDSLNFSNLKIIDAEGIKSIIKNSTSKYTLIHFWATWCAPCHKEFPEFLKFCSNLKDINVLLVATDYDSEDQRKKVLAVYRKLNTNLPLYLAATQSGSDIINKEGQMSIIRSFDKKSSGGIPYNIVIENKSGQLVTGTSDFKTILPLK
jgi:thiol-disulfide isomerase/thioredoxin